MPEASKKGADNEARRLIGNCVLFKGLSGSERSAISERAHIRVFDAGESIFSMAPPATR